MEELAERQEKMTKAQVSRARSSMGSVSYTFGVRCSVEHEGSHSEGEAAAR